MGSLLLGIDLGRYHSQISVFDEKKGEMISVSPYPSEDEGLIPTVLGVARDKRVWFYGKECEDLDGEKVEHLLDRIEQGKIITIYDVEFTPESILEKYLKKLLLLVRTQYPLDTISKLVITVENKAECLEKTVLAKPK